MVLNDGPVVGIGRSVVRAGACRAAYIVTGGEDRVDMVDEEVDCAVVDVGGNEMVFTGDRETVIAEEEVLMLRGVGSNLASTPVGVDGWLV